MRWGLWELETREKIKLRKKENHWKALKTWSQLKSSGRQSPTGEQSVDIGYELLRVRVH